MSDIHPLVILRLICGFFFVPHLIGKFTAQEASFAFFRAAGFKPAPPWAFSAMGIEVILAVCLLSGFFIRPAAWAACVYLLIAGTAVFKVSRKWLWHIGGCEFPVFWAICCGVVAASS